MTSTPEKPQPGPRLTNRQKRLLHDALARFDDIPDVRDYLLHEYPDESVFACLSDAALRYHRRAVRQSEATAARDQTEAQILRTGLARRAMRVSELTASFRRLGAMIRAAETPPQVRLLAERQRIAILSQIANEVGDISVETPTHREDDDQGDVIHERAVVLVDRLIEERTALAAAFAGVPQREPDALT